MYDFAGYRVSIQDFLNIIKKEETTFNNWYNKKVDAGLRKYRNMKKWFGLSAKPKYNTDNDARLAFMKSIEGKSLSEMKLMHRIKMKFMRDKLYETYHSNTDFVSLSPFDIEDLGLEKYHKKYIQAGTVGQFTAGDKGIYHTCANCGKDNLKIRKTCKYCGSDDFTWWSDYE